MNIEERIAKLEEQQENASKLLIILAKQMQRRIGDDIVAACEDAARKIEQILNKDASDE